MYVSAFMSLYQDLGSQMECGKIMLCYVPKIKGRKGMINAPKSTQIKNKKFSFWYRWHYCCIDQRFLLSLGLLWGHQRLPLRVGFPSSLLEHRKSSQKLLQGQISAGTEISPEPWAVGVCGHFCRCFCGDIRNNPWGFKQQMLLYGHQIHLLGARMILMLSQQHFATDKRQDQLSRLC